jgi:DNA-directed RNA polymerase sigma subunit (sigma70/sigma32)
MGAPAELYPALSHYGGKTHDHARLSAEEALELHRRCRNCRDEQAMRYLVRAYTRYAIAIALRYCQYGLPLSSLIAEGKVGIVHALNRFDIDCGHRFLTYVAYWIRLCLLNYVIHSLESADLNSETPQLFKLRREKVRITNLLGESDDSVQHFSDRTNVRA